jgi:flavin reductase (DIM6/NTAB) family NADH-FMN oxidoreductase RutF
MKEMPASKAYRLLEAGPVVLVSTSRNGRPNIMTMGFHMVVQHAPPLIGCIIGPWDYSYRALRETGECVIAIPTVDLARKVVDIGNCSGETIDKMTLHRMHELEIHAPPPALDPPDRRRHDEEKGADRDGVDG